MITNLIPSRYPWTAHVFSKQPQAGRGMIGEGRRRLSSYGTREPVSLDPQVLELVLAWGGQMTTGWPLRNHWFFVWTRNPGSRR